MADLEIKIKQASKEGAPKLYTVEFLITFDLSKKFFFGVLLENGFVVSVVSGLLVNAYTVLVNSSLPQTDLMSILFRFLKNRSSVRNS